MTHTEQQESNLRHLLTVHAGHEIVQAISMVSDRLFSVLHRSSHQLHQLCFVRHVVNTFADFRPTGGLTLPFAQSTSLNGEGNATATLSAVTVNAAVDDALWKRKGATP